ncbi:unnamed protein product [Closterium sp. NIES-53]
MVTRPVKRSKQNKAQGGSQDHHAVCVRGPVTGPSSADALHTFTLDSGASRSFFRDCTTLTPIAAPIPVSLADPTRGPVVARASTVLPCPAVPSSSLTGLHLPTFSTNLVSNATIQDVWVDTFIPGGQRVAICTCSRTGRHLATSGGCIESSVCVWSACGVLLVSGTLPPDLPCIEGRQRASPHKFPPTTAPLQTLHMDVWGPAPVGGTDQERYFLLVVDEYTRYTIVSPLRWKVDISGVLIPWIRATRRQLRKRFFEPLGVSFDSSGPDEGGDLAADDTAATRRSPRLETPPCFLTRPSSQPPQPAAVDSGVETAGAEPGGAETEGEGSRGAGSGGATTGGAGSWGAATGDAGSWDAATGGADSGGPVSPSGGGAVGDPTGGPGFGQPPQPDLLETLSPQAIRAWIVRRGSPSGGGYGPAGAGDASPGGTAGAGGTGGTAGGGGGAAGAGDTRRAADAGGAGATSSRGATSAGGAGPTSPGGTAGVGGAGAAGPGRARTGGAGAAGAGGAVRAGGTTGAAGSGGTGGTPGAGATGAGCTAGARGAGGATGAAGTGDAGGTTGARGPRAAGAIGAAGAGGAGGAVGAVGAGGAGAAGAGGAGAAGTALRRPFFYPQLQTSLLPPDSVLRKVLSLSPSIGLPLPLLCPPSDQSQPQLLPGSPLPTPTPHTEVTESLTERREPETRASTPVRARRVARPRPLFRTFLNLTFALVTELVDFAARSRPDCVASLVTESEAVCPSSVRGEPALGSDILEVGQFELECLAATLPRFASMLLCPEGEPDALDIPTPRCYAEASLFLCTDTTLPPFYVLVYVDDLVFTTANTEALALAKAEVQERHTCSDLGELRSYLGLQITRERARCTITLTQSHMVHQVLQRFAFQFSLPQPTPLSTSHSLSAPPSDESVEPSGPYPELVGCLMYLMTCTRPDLAYPLSRVRKKRSGLWRGVLEAELLKDLVHHV